MTEPNHARDESGPFPGLGEAFRVWLKIGVLSFGGPAGQIALMHRILVDEKRWIDEARFLHALNYCMLLPGPEAQQLATYIGWLLHRTLGGLIAGILFVLPGTIVMVALSAAYVAYASVPLVEAAFVGVKATVLVIVAQAVFRIGQRALKTWPMIAIAILAFIAIAAFSVPFPIIVLSAAILGVLVSRLAPSEAAGQSVEKASGAGSSLIDRMAAQGLLDHTQPVAGRTMALVAIFAVVWLGPVAALGIALGFENVFAQQAAFFSKLAVVTFGGAYAVLAYMAQQAVEAYGWLTGAAMLDGLGLAETTPGPLILVTQFVGFLGAHRFAGPLDPMTAGVIGALLTTWVTFVPCFLWIFAGAPYIERLRQNTLLSAALGGITAAVVGVILNLAVWFSLHVIFTESVETGVGPMTLDLPVLTSLDPKAAVLAVVAILLVIALKRGVLTTLVVSAGLSMAWTLF